MLDLRRVAAASDGDGDIQGVEQRLLLMSHWSSMCSSSSGDGPPFVLSGVNSYNNQHFNSLKKCISYLNQSYRKDRELWLNPTFGWNR